MWDKATRGKENLTPVVKTSKELAIERRTGGAFKIVLGMALGLVYAVIQGWGPAYDVRAPLLALVSATFLIVSFIPNPRTPPWPIVNKTLLVMAAFSGTSAGLAALEAEDVEALWKVLAGFLAAVPLLAFVLSMRTIINTLNNALKAFQRSRASTQK